MREILKKNWLKNIILFSAFSLVLLLTLIMTHLSGYKDYTMWEHLSSLTDGKDYSIISLIVIFLFFVQLVLLIASIFYTLLRKKNLFNYIYFLISTISNIVIIIYNVLFDFSSVFMVLLVIINLIILLFSLFVLIISKFANSEDDEVITLDNNKLEKENEIKTYKIKPLWFLVLDLISIIILLTVFFIPLYVKDSTAISLISTLSDEVEIKNSIYFLIMFLLFFSNITYFIYALSSFFYNKKDFYKKSRIVLFYSLIISLIFFMMGYFIKLYYTSNEEIVDIYSYIPLILMVIPIVIYSILYGMSHESNSDPKKSIRKLKVEPLVYVIVITIVTVLSLFLTIIKVDFSFKSSYYSKISSISLTGIRLLSEYQLLGGTYQVLAFIIVLMLLSSGIGLVLSLTSYFSKYKNYTKISKITIYVNFMFVFLLAISGFYFSIAQEINKEMIEDLIEYTFGSVSISLDYTCKIKTNMIYTLIIDVVIIAVMYITHGLEETMEEEKKVDSSLVNDVLPKEVNNNTINNDKEEELVSFDPCPAFTEMDNEINLYREDLKLRMKYQTKDETLKSLVNFVVEYARNSRLHLSYKNEDIATFISGLGSTRLSILQGMSGTGKTSLPKIFSEALFGNCHIIEVESSWKDKNELLGYYNEFSRNYTPKKFTQALYKTSLNSEIPTFIVLDEMNLSRIEYYFSDFLSLMENEEDKREIKLVNIKLNRIENGISKSYLALSNDHTMKIPKNVWFIGTANRDESTFVISDKVYDRAYTMNFNKRASKVTSYSDPMERKFITYDNFNNLLTKAKSSGKFNAEDNQIIKRVEELLAPYNISFGNRILNQIESFVNIYTACFNDLTRTDEAVETILLSKVVSKLEVKVVDDKEKLARDFEMLGLLKCKEFISKLNED